MSDKAFFSTKIEEWSSEQIARWLEKQKLSDKAVQAVRGGAVDGSRFLQLTRYPNLMKENFRELGVPDEELESFELAVKQMKELAEAALKSAQGKGKSKTPAKSSAPSPWADKGVYSAPIPHGASSSSGGYAQRWVDHERPYGFPQTTTTGKLAKAFAEDEQEERLRNRSRQIEGEVWDVRKETQQLKQELSVLEDMEGVLTGITRKRSMQLDALRESRQQRRVAGLPGAQGGSLQPWGEGPSMGGAAPSSMGGGGGMSLDNLLAGNPRKEINPSAIMNLSAGDLMRLGSQGLQTIRTLQAELSQVQINSEEQALEQLGTLKKLSEAVRELKHVKQHPPEEGEGSAAYTGEAGGPMGEPSGWSKSRHTTGGSQPLRTRVRKWPPAAVLKWLERKGFYGSVLDAFASARVSGAQLLEMGLSDFEGIGVGSDRLRNLLYKSVQELRNAEKQEEDRQYAAQGKFASSSAPRGKTVTEDGAGYRPADFGSDDEAGGGPVDPDLAGMDAEHSSKWTVEEVFAYLRSRSIVGEALLAVHDHDIDGSVLLSLSEEDLKNMGVLSVGMRRKMVAIIKDLNDAEAKRRKRESGAAVRAVAAAGKMKRMAKTAPLVPSWLFADTDEGSLVPASAGQEDKSVTDWTVEQVCQWLELVAEFQSREVGCFRSARVDGAALLAIDNEGLSRIGIESFSIRKRLLDAILELQELEQTRAKTSVKKWSKLRVERWLRAQGLHFDTAALFAANDIDGAQVLRLDAKEIERLGVTSLGMRNKLVDAIAELRQKEAARGWAKFYLGFHSVVKDVRRKVAKALWRDLPAWLYDDPAADTWNAEEEYASHKFVQSWDYKQTAAWAETFGVPIKAVGALRTNEINGTQLLKIHGEEGRKALALMEVRSEEDQTDTLKAIDKLKKLNQFHHDRFSRIGAKADARIRLTLDGDVNDIPPGSDERLEFESAVVKDIASSLGIPSRRIVVTAIRPGSIVVEFRILPDAEDHAAPTPGLLAEELVKQAARGDSPLRSGSITGALQSAPELLPADDDRMDGDTPKKWTRGQVLQWGLGRKFKEATLDAMRDGEVDGMTLLQMDHESLFKLGIKNILERKVVLAAIAKLKDEAEVSRNRTPLDKWAPRQVVEHLVRCGLPSYVCKAFEENEVDGATLRLLETSDLQAMGVATVGVRSRVEAAIAEAIAADNERVRLGNDAPGGAAATAGAGGSAMSKGDPSEPMEQWKADRVRRWLEAEGIDGKTVGKLTGVNGGDMVVATHAWLQNKGVKAWKIRRNVLDAIARIVSAEERVIKQGPPEKWSVREVGLWVRKQGFPSAVAGILSDNDVDGTSLLMMTTADLEELGIESGRACRRLGRRIRKLKGDENVSDDSEDDFGDEEEAGESANAEGKHLPKKKGKKSGALDTAALLTILGDRGTGKAKKATGGNGSWFQSSDAAAATGDSDGKAIASRPQWVDEWKPEDVASWAAEAVGADDSVSNAIMDSGLAGPSLTQLKPSQAAAAGVRSLGMQRRLAEAAKRLNQAQREQMRSRPVLDWTPSDVARWMLLNDVPVQDAAVFGEHDIDGWTLCDLDDDALQTLGLGSVSQRAGVTKILDSLFGDELQKIDQTGNGASDNTESAVPQPAGALELLRKRHQRRAEEKAKIAAAAAETEKEVLKAWEKENKERRKEEETRAKRKAKEDEEAERIKALVAAAEAARLAEEEGDEYVLVGQDGIHPAISAARRRGELRKPAFVADWKVADVWQWAQDSGLGENFAGRLKRNGVDGAALIELDIDDLAKIGINPIGEQKRVLREIASLRRKEESAFAVDWSTERLAAYLEGAGYDSDVVASVRDNKVDGRTFLSLDNQSISSLGIQAIGVQRRLLDAAARLRAVDSSRVAALPVADWDSSMVGYWVRSLDGMEDGAVAKVLELHRIDGLQLLSLDDADLSSMGLLDEAAGGKLILDGVADLKRKEKEREEAAKAKAKAKAKEKEDKDSRESTGKSDSALALALALAAKSNGKDSGSKSGKEKKSNPTYNQEMRERFVSRWSPESLGSYLGLRGYAEETISALKDIDGRAFVSLLPAEIENLGIDALGIRKRLMADAAALMAEEHAALRKPPCFWKERHVDAWIRNNGFGDEVSERALAHQVDGQRLLTMDPVDLRLLGIEDEEATTRFMDAVDKLKAQQAKADESAKESKSGAKEDGSKKDKGIESINAAATAARLAAILEHAERSRGSVSASSPGRRAAKRAAGMARALADGSANEVIEMLEDALMGASLAAPSRPANDSASSDEEDAEGPSRRRKSSSTRKSRARMSQEEAITAAAAAAAAAVTKSSSLPESRVVGAEGDEVVRKRLALARKEEDLRQLEDLESRIARREQLAKREAELRKRSEQLMNAESKERELFEAASTAAREESEMRRLEEEIKGREARLRAAEDARLRLSEQGIASKEGQMRGLTGESGDAASGSSSSSGEGWVSKNVKDMSEAEVGAFLTDAGLSKAVVETLNDVGVTGRELGRLKEDDLRSDEFGFTKEQARKIVDAVKARKKRFAPKS